MSTYNANEVNIAELSTTIATFNSNVMNQTIGTLNASVVNYSTNKPTSEFVLPRDKRSQVVMSGKNYENTNYQAATDGLSNALPFFIPTAQGRWGQQENLPEFGAFSVTSVPGTTAMQQTFQGVCDLDFVYFIMEIGDALPITWTGTNLAAWQAFAGVFSDWQQATSIIIKLDRNTGQVVQFQHVGYMLDQAYLAAGSTLVAQEAAVGPGVYTAKTRNPAGNWVYTKSPVNGLDKNAVGYVGFQTVDGQTWEGSGDDNVRGPFHLYGDHLYITGNAQKYASVLKIRCSDLSLVWRRTIDPYYYPYSDNPVLTHAGRVQRQVMVIPPRPGRANAFVVTTATDNFSYSTIDQADIGKLWDYYKSGGSIQAWEDFGATASPDFAWQTLIGPKPLDISNAIPTSVFRRVDAGATYNPMTIDGVTEATDSSGYILDEDGEVSLDLYAPLMEGYVFRDGSANGPLETDSKTTGVFNLLTGNTFVSFVSGLGALLGARNPQDPYSYPVMGSLIEFAKFDFTSSNVNVTQLTGGAFDASKSYIGTVQNGPYAGSQVTVTGRKLLDGVRDASGNLFPQQPTYDGSGNFQPVVKRIYLAQALANRAIVDKFERSELNTFGGGCYMGVAYDSSSDVFITPTGQMVSAGHGIEKTWTNCLFGNVVTSNILYKGVTSSYQVPDLSGGFVTNAYTDDSGVLQYSNVFYAGREFFRGLDSNGTFVPYKEYARDFAKQNPTTDFSRTPANYWYFFQTLGFNADENGRPLSNISTNAQLWIPGGDATGNVSTFNQAIYVQNRSKAAYDKISMIRDNMCLGQRFNRQGTCGFTGVKVGTGELMFSVNTQGYDISDHSTDFDIGEGGHNPIGIFRYRGLNADGCCVALLNMADSSANITSNAITGLPEAPFLPIPNRRILLATTKTRTFMFDYNLLVDKTTGAALTITHVPGDATLGYEQGCATNSWKNALLYESDFGTITQACVFNGHATDGTNFIHNIHGFSRIPPVINIASGMVPGKEVHGLDMDPYVVENTWKKPIGSRDPQLLSFISQMRVYVNPAYNIPGTPLPGQPSGGATDQQLSFLAGTLQSLISLGNPALVPLITAGTQLLYFLGWSQTAGAVDYTSPNAKFLNGSYTGTSNPHINCYNLPTILNNTLASNVQVASNAVTLGLYYKIAALGSSSLSNLQAYFSSLDALPGVGQEVIASATGVIAGGATVKQVLNTPYNVVKYQFLSSDTLNTGWANQGPQVYGNAVFRGSTNGIVECFDINNGCPYNKPKTMDASGNVVPQTVSNIRTPNLGIYNPEGQRTIPLIADGVMYGYGGNNKWSATGKTKASKIFMWTPYGK